ncbi:MAG: cell division protein FtsQ/DivIB [Candidatus Aminicenantaceae bacterium]
MSLILSTPYRSRTDIFSYEPMHFQRGKKTKKFDKKRIKKKINLKFKHVLFCFTFLVGTFYFIQQSYLFLISWDYLEVNEINIICSNEEVKNNIVTLLKKKNLANILLLDIGYLQQSIGEHRWIKETYIRKVFPASLRIEIKLREPVAVVKKEDLYLIDKSGIKLEKISSPENLRLPLLIDSKNFRNNFTEKLARAWECLNSLSAVEKDEIKVLDLTYHGWTTLHLKDKKTRLIVGYENISPQLKFFNEHHNDLESRFGSLEYIDLRFEDRFYIKPFQSRDKSIIPNSKKEIL